MNTQYLRTDKKGWTLLELIIVVTVLGLLSGLAIPTYRSQIKNANLKSAKSNILSNLKLAQSKALSERTLYRVKFDASTKTYQIGSDPNRDGIFTYETTQNLPQGISFTTASTYFEFSPDHTINTPASGVTITNGDANIRFFMPSATGYRIEVTE